MKTNQPKIELCEMTETGVERVQSFSPFCLKVHRALGATGLEYTSRRGMPRDFADLNPLQQLPVLIVDEDEVIADSTRILARLEQISVQRGGPSLLPRDARARAEAWLWEDHADRALNGYLVSARWADEKNWPLVRDTYFKGAPWFVRKVIVPKIRGRVLGALIARDFLRAGEAALWDDFRRILDALEARAPLSGFWVENDTPTVADIAIFGQLHGLRTPLTAAQGRELTLRPALVDYLDRVDVATFPGRVAVVPAGGLTAPRGHDMTRAACPSPIPTHARA